MCHGRRLFASGRANVGGKLALRPAELLKHEIGERGVRLAHAHRVLKLLVMHEHG